VLVCEINKDTNMFNSIQVVLLLATTTTATTTVNHHMHQYTTSLVKLAIILRISSVLRSRPEAEDEIDCVNCTTLSLQNITQMYHMVSLKRVECHPFFMDISYSHPLRTHTN